MASKPRSLLSRTEAADLLPVTEDTLRRWIREREKHGNEGQPCPPYIKIGDRFKFRKDLVERWLGGTYDLQGHQKDGFPPEGDPSLQWRQVPAPVAAPVPISPPVVAIVPAPAPPVAAVPAQPLPLEAVLQKIDQWREVEITRAYDDHWKGTAPVFNPFGKVAQHTSNRRYRLTQPGMDDELVNKLANVLGVSRADPAMSVPEVWHTFKQAYADIERYADRFRHRDFTGWPEVEAYGDPGDEGADESDWRGRRRWSSALRPRMPVK